VKLQGDDRASVVKGGLEILVKSGQIERFELETADLPEPEPEKPAAAPAAPAAAPAKPAPAAAPSPAAPAAGGGPAAPQPGAAKPQQS
jgi:hypothetical protein